MATAALDANDVELLKPASAVSSAVSGRAHASGDVLTAGRGWYLSINRRTKCEKVTGFKHSQVENSGP